MYVISSDSDGNFVKSSETLKSNLATWIDHYRMVSDSIDILDGKIVNYGINFEIVAI